jgi:hypothetical protein
MFSGEDRKPFVSGLRSPEYSPAIYFMLLTAQSLAPLHQDIWPSRSSFEKLIISMAFSAENIKEH